MGRRFMWGPVGDLVAMQQAMDRMFDENWRRWGEGYRRGERVHYLPLDVYTTPEELVVQASMPGIDPEAVEITIEGDTLTIKGERKPPLENVEYLLQERRYGPFSRTLSLNVPVEADKAEAQFDKGLLTLHIPKAEQVRPRLIKVSSK